MLSLSRSTQSGTFFSLGFFPDVKENSGTFTFQGFLALDADGSVGVQTVDQTSGLHGRSVLRLARPAQFQACCGVMSSSRGISSLLCCFEILTTGQDFRLAKITLCMSFLLPPS